MTLFPMHQVGGESLMAFFRGRKLRIAFLKGQRNRHTYRDILECCLLNEGEKVTVLNYIFMNKSMLQFTLQKTQKVG